MTEDDNNDVAQFLDTLRALHPSAAVRLAALEEVCINEVGSRRLVVRCTRLAVLDALPLAPGVH